MATIFPLSASVGQTFNGYEFDGISWNIIGIDLTQDYATQTELDTHTSDTTNVHGISNSASVVYTNDSRLSDARTPTNHASTHASAGSDPITIEQSQVTGLSSSLASKADKSAGYQYHSTLYYTSNGTFTKASYPWLRAIRVKVQGGGGGGGSAGASTSLGVNYGGGGGGGGYGERFITDINAISSSETITVGSGGAGGAASNTSKNPGSYGGNSVAFGITAAGGEGGTTSLTLSAYQGGGVSGTTDFAVPGSTAAGRGNTGSHSDSAGYSGSSFLGTSSSPAGNNGGGYPGRGYGSGGSGAYLSNSGTGAAGGNGAPGIVILELYA